MPKTVERIYYVEDMFGLWSAAVMYDDGTGRQTKSWGSETECVEALRERWPGVPIEFDG
jgi:hypothetical protein